MPIRLPDDAQDHVPVGLGQGVVAGELTDHIRKRRVTAREVEGMTGLVGILVVLETPLRAGDKVDEVGGSTRRAAGRGVFWGRSSRWDWMLGSASRSKPSSRRVARHTWVAALRIGAASADDGRRRRMMGRRLRPAVGRGAVEPAPRMSSFASVGLVLASAKAWASSASATPFSSSLRRIGSGSPENSARSVSRACFTRGAGR